MSTLKTALQIDLKGNLKDQAKANADAMERFGQRSKGALGGIRAQGAQFAERMGAMGGGIAAVAGGVTLGAATKKVADIEERFTRLGIAADLGKEKVGGLKNRIREVSQLPDIMLSDEELLSAVEQIVEKTGDLPFAEANLANLARTIQATGASGKDIGALSVELQKLGINTPKEILEALDTLTLQGKKGAFTLKDLATQGERVFSAFAAMGVKGPEAVRQLGALLQIARKGVGSPEMAATAFEGLIRDFQNNAVKLERAGIKVFGPDNKLRALPEVLKEILQKTGGDAKKLTKLFSSGLFQEESKRLVNVLAAEFARTGNFAGLDEFLKMMGDGKTITEDSARAATTLGAAYTDVKNRAVEMADTLLTRVLEPVAKGYSSLSDSGKDALIGSGITLAAAGTAMGTASGATALGLGGGALTGATVVAAPLVAAAATGVAVGAGVNEGIKAIDEKFSTGIGEAIGYGIALALSKLGSKESKLAIEINEGRIKKIKATGDISAEVKNGGRAP